MRQIFCKNPPKKTKQKKSELQAAVLQDMYQSRQVLFLLMLCNFKFSNLNGGELLTRCLQWRGYSTLPTIHKQHSVPLVKQPCVLLDLQFVY